MKDEDFEKYFFEHMTYVTNAHTAFCVAWLDGLLLSGKRFLEDGEILDAETCCVKIYGLIAEGEMALHEHFLPVKAIRLLNKKIPERQFNSEYVVLAGRAHNAFMRIKAKLKKSDIEILEFIRNRGSHLYLEGYTVVPNKKGTGVVEIKAGELKVDIRKRIMKNLKERGGYGKFVTTSFKKIEADVYVLSETFKSQYIRHADKADPVE